MGISLNNLRAHTFSAGSMNVSLALGVIHLWHFGGREYWCQASIIRHQVSVQWG